MKWSTIEPFWRTLEVQDITPQTFRDFYRWRLVTRKEILQVTAGKGTSRLSITNRESTPIESCEVRLLDQGEAEWRAFVPGTIAPSQTVEVAWSEFRANGQPMPSYIGQNRRNFIISCAVGNEARSAGIAF